MIVIRVQKNIIFGKNKRAYYSVMLKLIYFDTSKVIFSICNEIFPIVGKNSQKSFRP